MFIYVKAGGFLQASMLQTPDTITMIKTFETINLFAEFEPLLASGAMELWTDLLSALNCIY